MGASGCSAARFLAEKGARVRVTESASTPGLDTREADLDRAGIRAETGGHTREFCGDPFMVVVSPGVDLRMPEIAAVIPRGAPVIGELELGAMYCAASMVAVTGTNGKSTTVELIGHILNSSGRQAVVCGNIGIPLTSVACDLNEDSVAVVEVSSFQLETVRNFKPRIAVLLNVSDDHYDRHENYDRYKKEKLRIFINQDENDYALVRSCLRDDVLAEKMRGKIICFDRTDINMDAAEIPLKGEHNIENVRCAVTASRLMGVAERQIHSGIRNFKTLDCRFESLGTFNGIEYIDDSKATNIDATKRALESMAKRAVLIAGGRGKGGDYRRILPIIREKVKAMVVIGESREKLISIFSNIIPVIAADTMKEAVECASREAVAGEAVLLSPMCSSFDMFKNYRERGEAFRKEVLP
ncbi:MAG: UDP-N-acetylmuramoyl-L-alanine--D-glutamate ligase [Candidatus Omnitrophica bacterium]|nr:UDP-N-acetylmuramoyl-L-alanine--D-glutamate ligase [Candidatus Omnitrophota bacterium]MBU1128812.1 UDP-N-acetylmuramoyl-L-alanine--D-glutamate ligase [Candidatus Omnitrophota bacterium]MBU1851195.1 UDP-N-acetylmuramoyl-L-alanine--D-glutamate ligase [Candidatus Omnitrophota bacterium]